MPHLPAVASHKISFILPKIKLRYQNLSSARAVTGAFRVQGNAVNIGV